MLAAPMSPGSGGWVMEGCWCWWLQLEGPAGPGYAEGAWQMRQTAASAWRRRGAEETRRFGDTCPGLKFKGPNPAHPSTHPPTHPSAEDLLSEAIHSAHLQRLVRPNDYGESASSV